MAEQKPDGTRGYLVINVLEANGKNKDENFTWDSSNFEGFVKVELRGGYRNVKATTSRRPAQGGLIHWKEQLAIEVLDNANELRIMLCKDKVVHTSVGAKRGTAVIAACGIYADDIINAVPIDKYFELFKPNAGGEGGFIRLALDFVTDPSQIPKPEATANGSALSAAGKGSQPARKRRGLVVALLAVVAAGVAGYVGKRVYDSRRKDKK